VILSDALHDSLGDNSNGLLELTAGKIPNVENDAVVFFDEEVFSCKIKKITRFDDVSDGVFEFVLFSHDLPIDVILDKSLCVLEINEYKFSQIDHTRVKWSDNHLTIKARRILK
tara:strand:+ start:201 stop:542 length:342 start_codon:yes stop_codon:yes gene_type:complete